MASRHDKHTIPGPCHTIAGGKATPSLKACYDEEICKVGTVKDRRATPPPVSHRHNSGLAIATLTPPQTDPNDTTNMPKRRLPQPCRDLDLAHPHRYSHTSRPRPPPRTTSPSDRIHLQNDAPKERTRHLAKLIASLSSDPGDPVLGFSPENLGHKGENCTPDATNKVTTPADAAVDGPRPQLKHGFHWQPRTPKPATGQAT